MNLFSRAICNATYNVHFTVEQIRLEKNGGSAIRIFLRHSSQIPADSLSLFNQAFHFKSFDNGLK